MKWTDRIHPAARRCLPVLMAAVAAAQYAAAGEARKETTLDFLNATAFDARITSQFTAANTGIPVFDRLMEQVAKQPEMAQMQQQMKARLLQSLPTIRDEMAKAYSTRFSEEDLVALTDFFRTPPGRRYVELQPELQRLEAGLIVSEALKGSPQAGTGLGKLDQMQEQKRAERAKLEQRAAGGDRDAQYALGQAYCSTNSGLGMREALAKCFEWKKRAAEAGQREAQFDIGFSYVDGRYGNGKSGKEMFRWMKLAADQGHIPACFYVGSAYAGNTRVFGNDTPGVEVDAAQAEAWLTKAAEGGSMGAIMDLGSMYMEGRVVKKSIPDAIRWYSEGAARRNTFAMRKLGEIYETGMAGEPNPSEALKWYKLAAGVK